MLIKTRGIVFRTIKYSETSLITDIYTEEKGLQRYIINGVRSKKAKVKASLLQVMSLLDLVAYHREGRDLHRIRELRPAFVYRSIPFSVRKGAVGLFMVEVARKTIRETEAHRALFDFLYDTFRFLDTTEHPVANLHLNFLLHLAAHLGFTPGGDYGRETPFFDLQEGVFVSRAPGHPYSLDEEKSRLLYNLLCISPTETHAIRMAGQTRRTLLESLLNFYRLHIDNFPPINSHLILQDILE
jgi:DNA repair protein RecO (recombination protein O)